jgi:hypothetical protein
MIELIQGSIQFGYFLGNRVLGGYTWVGKFVGFYDHFAAGELLSRQFNLHRTCLDKATLWNGG